MCEKLLNIKHYYVVLRYFIQYYLVLVRFYHRNSRLTLPEDSPNSGTSFHLIGDEREEYNDED